LSLKVFSLLAPGVSSVAGIVPVERAEVEKKMLSRSPRSGGSRLHLLQPAYEDGGTHIPPSSSSRLFTGWDSAFPALLRGDATIGFVNEATRCARLAAEGNFV